MSRLASIQKLFKGAIVGIAALLGTGSAIGQAADGSPIKLVVPYPAGTTVDVIGRMLGEGISKELGRPVVVDNRVGASGSIAMEYVAASAPDGNTVLLAVNNILTVNPLLQANPRVDPMKALEPVAHILEGSYILVANPKSAYKDLPSVIAAAKTKPGAINYSSYGVGSMPHLCAEQMQAMVDIKLNHVPYKTSPVNDLVGGTIELGFEPANAIPFIQNGRLRGLAVTSKARLADLQSMPSLSEVIPEYECVPFVGMLVPAKTPSRLRSSLEQAVLTVAATPDFAARMHSHNQVVKLGGQEAFAAILRRDHAKWSKLIKDLDLKLN